MSRAIPPMAIAAMPRFFDKHQVFHLGYDQPGGDGGYRGYVDDISLTG
jgi:hypothetical protein